MFDCRYREGALPHICHILSHALLPAAGQPYVIDNAGFVWQQVLRLVQPDQPGVPSPNCCPGRPKVGRCNQPEDFRCFNPYKLSTMSLAFIRIAFVVYHNHLRDLRQLLPHRPGVAAFSAWLLRKYNVSHGTPPSINMQQQQQRRPLVVTFISRGLREHPVRYLENIEEVASHFRHAPNGGVEVTVVNLEQLTFAEQV